MSPIPGLVISSLLAYLIGSIPFSLLIARYAGGIDLRQHGSGNVGATNVARTMGAKWGILALLLDASKGMLSVGVIPLVIQLTPDMKMHQAVLGAILAVLGHMFSIWLGLKGGKGVATALGGVVFLSPWVTLCAFVAFLLTILTTRIMSLSSIIAAVVFAVTQLAVGGGDLWTEQNWSLAGFAIAVPLLIIVQHRSNISRLLRGEEKKLSFGSKQRETQDHDLDQSTDS